MSNLHIDAQGNSYTKDAQGDLYIDYKDDKKETICIHNFQEGDYGLWLETEAPYFIEDGKIVRRSTSEEAKVDKVLELEENKFLEKEERIKDDFLWIYAGEKIVFPQDKEQEAKVKNKKKDKTDKNNSKASWAKNSAASSSSNQSKEESKQKDKEKEMSDNSLSSGGGNLYVCSGAELKCSFGDQNSNLKVVATHNIKIDGNLMATMMDNKPMVNIQPFGKCKSMANPTVASATAASQGNLQPMPCVPTIPAPWLQPKTDVRISGKPVLLEYSKLNCAYAGLIEVVDPGQDFMKD